MTIFFKTAWVLNNVENRSNIFLVIPCHHHHRCGKSFISQATVLLAILCRGSSRLKFWPRWIFRSVETLLEIQHQTKRFSFLCSFQFYHLKMFLFIQKTNIFDNNVFLRSCFWVSNIFFFLPLFPVLFSLYRDERSWNIKKQIGKSFQISDLLSGQVQQNIRSNMNWAMLFIL